MILFIPVEDLSITTSSCGGIYGFIEQLLVDLDVTKHCCLTTPPVLTVLARLTPPKVYLSI